MQLKRFLSIKEPPPIETEQIASLKKAIVTLQEDVRLQRTIAETVSEENRTLKAKIETLETGQAGLEKKVDTMTTLFQTTFKNVTKTTMETLFNDEQKKTGSAR